jgi:nucleoid DNA-binding protein
MANDKLTWLELRKAVAEYANTSEQEAEQFLNALLDGITEGLKNDQQVKIKGLGSFSLKAVAPRKSVNIATGESYTIDGYNKLTFSVESMLKESVEKRIEQPKTEAVMAELNNDPIKKLGEQASEIVDLLAELGQAVTQPSLEVEEVSEIPEVIEVPEVPNVEVKEPIERVQEKTETPIVTPAQKPTCKCNCRYTPWVIIAILVAIIIGSGVYFREALIQWWQCMQDCQPIAEEVEEVQEVVEVQEVQEVVIPLAEKPREYVNFIGIEKVGKDSRLAWIAYKYYAQKDLWVFIYEANRDIIKDPTHVRPGQYIRIPELSEEYRNLYNPELKQLVDSLAVEYLSIQN